MRRPTRRPLRLLAVVGAIVALLSGCEYHLLEPEGSAPLRYRDLIFPGVTKTADIVYGSSVNLSGQTVTLRLDLYRPTGDTLTKRPAVVWVHGGSFSSGSKTSPELVDQATQLGRMGYVSASISYRLEPTGCSAAAPTATCVQTMQNARADAQTAVRFLRTNASTYGIDATRIAIAGTSAGAITALSVGYGSGEDPSASVRAAVSLSGANLVSSIGPGDAPALLFHGTTDTAVPYSWATSTVTQATNKGLDVFLTTYEGEGHVPYGHRNEIIARTRNFLYWALWLIDAPS
ncbi:MAG: alpha/beta hydrolase [Actinomycetota bacterium]